MLNEEIKEWLDENPNIELVSVTPTFNNVKDRSDDVAIMTATIIYN